METIFDDVFVADKKMAPSDVRVWLNSLLSSRNMGVVRLYGIPGDNQYLLLKRGKWFLYQPNGLTEIDPVTLVRSGEMCVGFLPLSFAGMLHFNLLLYSTQTQSKISFDNPGSPAGTTDPYLIKMSLGNSIGSILYNGTTNLPHSLYISNQNVLDETGIPDQLLRWNEDPACKVAVFSFDPALDAWHEMALRRSFKLLYDRTLERCEIQTGRSIIESFARITTMFAAEQNINIAVKAGKWVNNEFFISSGEAAHYYRLALNELLEHFSAVIGSRLLSFNLREVFAALPGGSRESIKAHKILPEGYLS